MISKCLVPVVVLVAVPHFAVVVGVISVGAVVVVHHVERVITREDDFLIDHQDMETIRVNVINVEEAHVVVAHIAVVLNVAPIEADLNHPEEVVPIIKLTILCHWKREKSEWPLPKCLHLTTYSRIKIHKRMWLAVLFPISLLLSSMALTVVSFVLDMPI